MTATIKSRDDYFINPLTLWKKSPLPHLMTIILFVFALVSGSFLAVIVVRLPLEEDIIFTRSKCRNCHHQLGILDITPFIGWLMLRGKCRYCQDKISPLYPIIEWGVLGIFVWSYMIVPTEFLWAGCLLGWLLLTLSAIDIRHHLLPNSLNLIVLVAGLGFNYLYFVDSMIDVLAGTVIGYVLFASISYAYRRIRRKEGLGLGDAKLLAAGGAWVGWQGLASVILISSVGGLIIASIWMIMKKKEITTQKIPFGPFLAVGIWLTWLYGPLL